MASRRLAISSLLCDDDGPATSSPVAASRDSQLSPSLAQQYPTQQRQHQQPQALPVRPYGSPVRDAHPHPTSPYGSPQYEALSPASQSMYAHRGRRSEDLQLHGSGFPRRQHSDAYVPQSQPQLQPQIHPSYPFLPPPALPSPVNVHEPSRRRASAQIDLRQYSPLLTAHPPSSSSLPSIFPSPTHPFSISPSSAAPQSARVHPSSSRERQSQRSPVFSRFPLPELQMPHSSASLSPTAPLSGLDVLVQAATEERERIDVHRRLSGSEEPPLSQSFNQASSRPSSHSPVSFRNDIRAHGPPPTPPYTASSQDVVYPNRDQTDAYFRGQAVSEDGRAVKRRRASLEPAHTQETERFQPTNYSPREAPQPQSPLYIQSTSSRTYIAQEAPAPTSSQLPVPPSPAESEPMHHTRRSPPRSKPRPKKPGSAALAIMEKEFQDVDLSDRVAGSAGEGSSRQKVSRTAASGSQKQRKPHAMGMKSAPSNERGAVDDEEVDDFFMSTFDSPQNAQRQIPPPGSIYDGGLSVTEDEHTSVAARWGSRPSKHSAPMQPTPSTLNLRSPISETMEGFTDHSSPMRRTPGPDNEGLMSEVEADLLGELADAAGAATSEEERSEFDGHETDAMEVDVENELLSLLDGPSQRQRIGAGGAQRSSAALDDGEVDRMSMPPPDSGRASGAQVKGSKKSSSKPRARAKIDGSDSVKLGKSSTAHNDDSGAKPSKGKLSSRPRPAKGAVASEKAKAVKMSKELSSSVAASSPTLPAPIVGLHTGELFPVVTSSGRMVTKSKKSAAAAAASAPSAQSPQPAVPQNRKKSAAAASGSGDGTASRSRSQSAMPRASVDPEVYKDKHTRTEEEKPKEIVIEEAEAEVDDRLYCICKTKYDEDRVMIACDRCDEWYHTQCLDMSDLAIELVDQFICPICIAQNSNLNLRTTYKQRCFSGTSHPHPDSADACHKPSRGAYSKYCSDDCGVRYLHRKIEAWANNGGDVHRLWESVKDAKRREGFVVREPGQTLPKAILAEMQRNAEATSQENKSDVSQAVPDGEEINPLIMQLEKRLQRVVRDREDIKKELEIVAWRERLLELATARAESVGGCGWDQRLVYNDDESLEFGAEVIESYEYATQNGHSENGQDMDVEEHAEVGEWWCQGKKKCDRHNNWQKVRAQDIEKERLMKERALADLTTLEREIRSRIEDILHPQSRNTGSLPESTFTFRFNSMNGDDGIKRGRKKSAL